MTHSSDPEELIRYDIALPAGVIALIEAEAERRKVKSKHLARQILVDFAEFTSLTQPALPAQYRKPRKPPIDPAILKKMPEGTFLDDLCKKKHEYKGTGKSLFTQRSDKKGRVCLQCLEESKQFHKERAKRLYRQQPWIGLLQRTRTQARKQGVEFKLSPQWGMSNSVSHCPFNGIPIHLRRPRKMARSPNDAVIVRHDLSVGFLPGNCQIVSRKAAEGMNQSC